MISLSAPYPANETTTILPNPDFSDVQNNRVQINVRRSMNNTRRTYVKKPERKALTYRFRLTRAKGLELRAFIESYYRSEMQMTNHKDEKWVVWLVNNPFEFNTAGRAGENYPGKEYETVELQFEGSQV